MYRLVLAACASLLSHAAVAQVQTLERIEVVGSPPPPALGTAGAASEGEISREQIEARPVYRPGEIVETVPGLIVTQHSGEGKANQYFLRGFNLDHGTDLALFADGMPVNMRTHGHGQGYADLNFLIPELVSGIAYRKGPYFAEEGDFASAGAARIEYLDKLDRDVLAGTEGSFGFLRGLGATSRPLGDGSLLSAVELQHYDGPWERPDDLQKANGILRWTRGRRDDGFSLTAMAYGARWNSTDQIAARAVPSGDVGRFGTLDPTDGGNAERYSLSARWNQPQRDGQLFAAAYAIRSTLTLYNDFTYFLRDPVNGDQFKQTDARTVVGAEVGRRWLRAASPAPSRRVRRAARSRSRWAVRWDAV
jgi:hypothetical protein